MLAPLGTPPDILTLLNAHVVKIAQKDETGKTLFSIALQSTKAEMAQELANIAFPNDAYIGCVHGNKLPQQGFEGLVFEVDAIELRGQTTGFSAGN